MLRSRSTSHRVSERWALMTPSAPCPGSITPSAGNYPQLLHLLLPLTATCCYLLHITCMTHSSPGHPVLVRPYRPPRPPRSTPEHGDEKTLTRASQRHQRAVHHHAGGESGTPLQVTTFGNSIHENKGQQKTHVTWPSSTIPNPSSPKSSLFPNTRNTRLSAWFFNASILSTLGHF